MHALELTDPERQLLLQMLESALGEKRVEVRRTEFSSTYHDELAQQETVLRQLLDKLRHEVHA